MEPTLQPTQAEYDGPKKCNYDEDVRYSIGSIGNETVSFPVPNAGLLFLF